VKFQLGPWNPAFCSDELLRAIAEASQSHGWRIQTHVAETRYQAEFARRKYGKSWTRYLLDIGMLTHRFSGAHCVWFDDDDIALMKQSGAQAVHNPGSNLRLQSGVAPVRGFLAAGIPVAFGIDSLGMNDDEDIFQDLRLARLLHGAPGIDGRLIPAAVLLGMATRTGATVTGFDGVGQLAEGGPADVVLMSRSEIEGFSTDHPIADLVLMRAKPAHIRTVIIGGRILIDDGRWREHAPLRVLEELARSRRLAGPTPSSAREQLKDALRGYLRQMPR
jgi:5-methylthioadenosine/S-adenosylhomocysteine deaminase